MDGADNIDKSVSEKALVDFMSDTDYQLDTSTVTMQFTGFESTMHGVMQFEMAVGTQPNGEDVLSFTEANIIHLEELDPAGKGNDSKSCIHLPCETFKYANLPHNSKPFC